MRISNLSFMAALNLIPTLCILPRLFFLLSGKHNHNFEVQIAFKLGKLNCKAFTKKFSGKLTFQELRLVARFPHDNVS